MFRGDFSLTMDAKGRLAVPTRHRERLSDVCGGKLVLTISLLERCLVAYPFPDWQRIETKLDELPAFDEKAQAVSHLLIGHATELDMDGQGRILLPQSLRDFASLGKRVRMVGLIRKFELWNEEVWMARREEMLGDVTTVMRNPSPSIQGLVL